jgi:hypothetical protein
MTAPIRVSSIPRQLATNVIALTDAPRIAIATLGIAKAAWLVNGID